MPLMDKHRIEEKYGAYEEVARAFSAPGAECIEIYLCTHSTRDEPSHYQMCRSPAAREELFSSPYITKAELAWSKAGGTVIPFPRSETAARRSTEVEPGEETTPEAPRLSPKEQGAQWLSLAEGLKEAGQLPEACEQLDRIVSAGLDANGWARYLKGSWLAENGRYDEAATCLKESLNADPSWTGAHLELGKVLYALGRHSEARSAFSWVVNRDRDFFRVEDAEEAEKWLDRLSRDSSEPEATADQSGPAGILETSVEGVHDFHRGPTGEPSEHRATTSGPAPPPPSTPDEPTVTGSSEPHEPVRPIDTGLKVFWIVSIVAGYLLGLFVGGAGALNIDEDLGPILLLVGLAFIVYALVIQCVVLHRIWRAIQDGQARTTPGKAVGFLFIPFFNLYWVFQAFWGWAVDFNSYCAIKKDSVRRVSEGVALAICILSVLSVVPILSFLTAPANLVLLILFLNQAIRGVNGLAGTRTPSQPLAEEPSAPATIATTRRPPFPGLAEPEKKARGRKWATAIAVSAAGIVVLALVVVGWVFWRDIREGAFLFTRCERMEDGADGYARYRHKSTGQVYARFEGVLFEQLGPNAQGYPEYGHRDSEIVFVHLPGGEVLPEGVGGPVKVGPFLIMKSPFSLEQLQDLVGVDLSETEGALAYGTLWDLARSLGMSHFGPTLDQRHYAFGKGWQPTTGTALYPPDRATPNDYGIVRLKHNPNLGDPLRPVLNLTRPGAAKLHAAGGEPASGARASREHPAAKVVAKITDQNWSGIAAGTEVVVDGGQKATIRSDLGALEVNVLVSNGTGSGFSLRAPVLLTGGDGKTVSRFRLLSLEPPQGDVDRLGEIEILDGQSVLMELESKAAEVTELRAASPLFVEFPAHGWRLQVGPLPEDGELFANKE